MQRVFVTGATGFIGKHLTAKLTQGDYDTHVLVRPTSTTAPLESLPSPPTIHVHDGSTSDLLSIVSEIQPTTVFHLAAYALSQHQPEDITPLVRSNILFGTQLLETCVNAGTKHFVNTGTAWQHYQGQDYNPVNLYAATKKAFQDISRYYLEASALQIITLKLFDVYGPDDHRDKLFRQLQKAATEGTKIEMSPGKQRLDLTYVDDVVRAFIQADTLLADREHFSGQSFAVTSGTHTSLRDVVSEYERAIGKKLPVEWGARPYRDRQVMKHWEGKPLQGWEAQIDLPEGIRRMIEEDGIVLQVDS